MSVENFFIDLVAYFGPYKSADQRELTKDYVSKRFSADEYSKLKKYIYENHHANYGPPLISAIKRCVDVAYKEDKVIFNRPKRQVDGHPLWKCGGCGKLSALDTSKCPWCGEYTSGNGSVHVPDGYFRD